MFSPNVYQQQVHGIQVKKTYETKTKQIFPQMLLSIEVKKLKLSMEIFTAIAK